MSRANEFAPKDVQVFEGHQSHYVYTDEVKTAVRVALATDRPLLVRGAPGSGKSTLAKNVALTLKWRYRELVVTSRTQARDLAYQFDALRRLQDAQGAAPLLDERYVAPKALFWAFAPVRANDFVKQGEAREKHLDTPCVVLLDEIDKADPDVPNDLLVTFGELRFTIEETGEEIKAVKEMRPLIIATTNDERSLPPAFLRRCIVLRLSPPDLLVVAETHHGNAEADKKLYREVLAKHNELVDAMTENGLRPPSTAEYLDTVAACRALGSNQLAEIAKFTLEKERVTDDA